MHSDRLWRAATVTVPSGADQGVIYTLLRAPIDSSMVLTCLSVWGQPTGSIYPYFFLVPPGEVTGASYTITASNPVYCCGAGLALGGTLNLPGPALGFQIAIRDTHPNGPFIIPAGWTLGIEMSASIDVDVGVSVVGVLANAA